MARDASYQLSMADIGRAARRKLGSLTARPASLAGDGGAFWPGSPVWAAASGRGCPGAAWRAGAVPQGARRRDQRVPPSRVGHSV